MQLQNKSFKRFFARVFIIKSTLFRRFWKRIVTLTQYQTKISLITLQTNCSHSDTSVTSWSNNLEDLALCKYIIPRDYSEYPYLKFLRRNCLECHFNPKFPQINVKFKISWKHNYPLGDFSFCNSITYRSSWLAPVAEFNFYLLLTRFLQRKKEQIIQNRKLNIAFDVKQYVTFKVLWKKS